MAPPRTRPPSKKVAVGSFQGLGKEIGMDQGSTKEPIVSNTKINNSMDNNSTTTAGNTKAIPVLLLIIIKV